MSNQLIYSNNLFENLYQLLILDNKDKKFHYFQEIYNLFLQDKLQLTPLNKIEVFTKPSYHTFCTIVDARDIPNRKNLALDENKASLLHSIAHIEYSAIDLALDACYRFQNMPKEFYTDWLEVANDEIRHFKLIEELLNNYKIQYGDLPVHQGLFEASMKTLELIPRMALIPRYMEANGLDANAMLIDKLKKFPDTSHIISILQIILDEEIDHVRKGDRWYKYGCSQKLNFSCDYFKIVNSIYPNSFNTKKKINIQARKQAGFSDEELEILSKPIPLK